MSWSGTVNCGHCHEKGHNKTNCPKMRREAAANPNSYAARQVATIEARKSRPKICSYCDTSGHTRAGCDTVKQHKVAFIKDGTLWRTAVVKWMNEVGLGTGSLVQSNDASYHRGDQYMYPQETGYIPPVGMIMNAASLDICHYAGIMNTTHWQHSQSMLSFERIGATEAEHSYHTMVGIALPCIPGIVPRYGKGYYRNEQMDRRAQTSNTDWTVVSPTPTENNNDKLLCPKTLKKYTKTHFAGPQQETQRSFYTFDSFQRGQLQQYVNGEIELSEMKDPEVPATDT